MKNIFVIAAFLPFFQSTLSYAEGVNEQYFIAYNTAQESKFPGILKKQMQNTAMLDQIAVETLRKIGQHDLANQYFNRPDIQSLLRNQVQSFLMSESSNQVFDRLSTQLLSELYSSDELRALYQNSKTKDGRKFVEASALVSLQTQQFINDAYKKKFDKASSDQLEADIESIFTKLGFNATEDSLVDEEDTLSIQVNQAPKLKKDSVISEKTQVKDNVQAKVNAQTKSVTQDAVTYSNAELAQSKDLNGLTVNVTQRAVVPAQTAMMPVAAQEGEQVAQSKVQLEVNSEEKPELGQKLAPVVGVVQPMRVDNTVSATGEGMVVAPENDDAVQSNLTVNVTQRAVVPAQSETSTSPVERVAPLQPTLPVGSEIKPEIEYKPQFDNESNTPAEQIAQPGDVQSRGNLSINVTHSQIEEKPQSVSVSLVSNENQPAVLGLATSELDQTLSGVRILSKESIQAKISEAIHVHKVAELTMNNISPTVNDTAEKID